MVRHKREYGTGCLFLRGERWYIRMRIEGRIVTRVLIDPDSGEHPRTRSHAARIAAHESGKYSRTGSATLIGDISLEELDGAFMAAYPNAHSKRNLYMRKLAINRFCAIFPRVGDITHERLGKYCTERLQTASRKGGQISAASVNRELSFLQRLLNWAVETKKIERNPVAGFRKLEEGHHRERVLSPEEIRRLLAALEAPRYAEVRGIILLALFTGMRQGEILALRWDDLDEEHQVIDLLRSKGMSEGRRIRRKIPVPDPVWGILMARSRDREWVFPSPRTGKPWVKIRVFWENLLAEAQIEGFRFHDLRHTAGTLLAQETDIATLMEILGHRQISTTKRYLNPTMERKRGALDAFAGEYLKEKTPSSS